MLVHQLRICTIRSQSTSESGLRVGVDVHLMKIMEWRVAVDVFHLRDWGYCHTIITMSRLRVNFKFKEHPSAHFDSSLRQGHPSLSDKARNGVIRVFDLERSLSPPRLMQKTSSASLLVAEYEAGKKGNERLLLPHSALAIIVDFEDGRMFERFILRVFCHPKHVPRLCSYIHGAKIPFQYQLTHTGILDEQLLTIPYSSPLYKAPFPLSNPRSRALRLSFGLPRR
jgi:hypothetical protein